MLPISIIPIFFQDALLTEQNLQYNIYIGKRTRLLTNKRIERRTKLIHIRFPLQFYFFSGWAPSNPRAPIVYLKVKQQQCGRRTLVDLMVGWRLWFKLRFAESQITNLVRLPRKMELFFVDATATTTTMPPFV